jgi:hypothetical protein
MAFLVNFVGRGFKPCQYNKKLCKREGKILVGALLKTALQVYSCLDHLRLLMERNHVNMDIANRIASARQRLVGRCQRETGPKRAKHILLFNEEPEPPPQQQQPLARSVMRHRFRAAGLQNGRPCHPQSL